MQDNKKKFYSESKAYVRMNCKLIEYFDIKTDVMQKWAMQLWLFNAFVDVFLNRI